MCLGIDAVLINTQSEPLQMPSFTNHRLPSVSLGIPYRLTISMLYLVLRCIRTILNIAQPRQADLFLQPKLTLVPFIDDLLGRVPW
jgi:hypothetical protein